MQSRDERARRGTGLGVRQARSGYWQVTPTALKAATTSLRA